MDDCCNNVHSKLEKDEDTHCTGNPCSVESYKRNARKYYSQDDYSQALESYFKALEIEVNYKGMENPDTIVTINCIGAVYERKEDYPQVLEYYFKALEAWEKVLGKDHPKTAIK